MCRCDERNFSDDSRRHRGSLARPENNAPKRAAQGFGMRIVRLTMAKPCSKNNALIG
jgi:hypothetical protein